MTKQTIKLTEIVSYRIEKCKIWKCPECNTENKTMEHSGISYPNGGEVSLIYAPICTKCGEKFLWKEK